ncbi:MAG: hypothetical protein ACJAZO_003932 [Myxococcota bacterium]|jgi:hypothetical protein
MMLWSTEVYAADFMSSVRAVPVYSMDSTQGRSVSC